MTRFGCSFPRDRVTDRSAVRHWVVGGIRWDEQIIRSCAVRRAEPRAGEVSYEPMEREGRGYPLVDLRPPGHRGCRVGPLSMPSQALGLRAATRGAGHPIIQSVPRAWRYMFRHTAPVP